MKSLFILFETILISAVISAQTPVANAGSDKIICGVSGQLNAVPSIGEGIWTTDYPQYVSFAEPNNPNTVITSSIFNEGNASIPCFEIVWTETYNLETSRDTVLVLFSIIPNNEIDIIPPKCFGEQATIKAVADTLPEYIWNFGNAIIGDHLTNSSGGNYQYLVNWDDGQTSHPISLSTVNDFGCISPFNVVSVYEPQVPEFDYTIFPDTCGLSNGEIIFNSGFETSAFYWLNAETGPEPGTPISEVYNLPAGEYDIRVSYLTPNTMHYAYYIGTFGTANCIDTLKLSVDSHNLFDLSCPADIEITSYEVFPLSSLSGTYPSNGTFFIEGEETTVFNSDNFNNETYNVTYLYFDVNTDCQGVCDFNITVNINSGVTRLESEILSIYPNPTTENFSISNYGTEPLKISVIDINGKTKINIPDYLGGEICIKNLNSGVYFVKIYSSQISVCKKLVIE